MSLGKNTSIATPGGDNFLDVNATGGRSILNITEEDPLDLSLPFELNSEVGKEVFPKPGFCIKSKTIEDEKVFINMCHCEDVPKPDEHLLPPKDPDGDETIRFPLGLGLPRREKDKSGKDCICFDVVINSEFLNTLLKNEDMRSFVLSICIQGIADKYGIFVRDDCCIKLTKTYHGTVQKHFIKNTQPRISDKLPSTKDNSRSSAPLIRLMESSPDEDKTVSDNSSVQSVRPKNSQSKSKCPVQLQKKQNNSSIVDKTGESVISKPFISKLLKKSDVQYGLFQIPASDSYPNQYVLEANLHKLSTDYSQLKVFVSNNRVVINQKMCNYTIDISLPSPVIQERCRANFCNGRLAVVLPVADQ